MELSGLNLVAGRWVAGSGGEAAFAAVSPATGKALETAFSPAGRAEVKAACAAAAQAAPLLAAPPPRERATFLDACAEEIEALGDALIGRAMAESGLPRPRLEGERGRTCGQLRLFATEVREGGWQGVRIDPAQPNRKPAPRPDLRMRKVPLGPVAVFGASNFPLAFSVGGGDTASALAAGCPVVVKGHPAHPGTGEMVATALLAAVQRCGLPLGKIALLNGSSPELGAALVRDPRIAAVGFTGSRARGLALVRLAAKRPVPIPVYAEMSSVNPVVLLPGALAERAEALGAAFVASLTMGAGQFCTNPGLVLALDGPNLDRFVAAAAAALRKSAAATMLSPSIHRAYAEGVARLSGHADVEERARGRVGEGVNQGQGGLFETTAVAFLADPALSHEVFGASSLVVRCPNLAAMEAVLAGLEGQLTATLHLAPGDHAAARRLIPLLEARCGRILATAGPRGWRWGTPWCTAAPIRRPATAAPPRWARWRSSASCDPSATGDLPADLLPEAVADANPWRLPRRVDGGPQPVASTT